VIRTGAVTALTTVILVRHRFDLTSQREGRTVTLLAEDAGVTAFAGLPSSPMWLAPDEAESLLDASPSGNVSPEQAGEFLAEVLAAEAACASVVVKIALRYCEPTSLP
jgi:hypothetical protein